MDTTIPDFVVQQYTQPWRKYHNINHVYDILQLYHTHQNTGSGLTESESFSLFNAIWYHDVIYYIPSHAVSNEELSARHYQLFMPLDQHGAAIIRATEHHFDGFVTDDLATNLMLDWDIMAFASLDYNRFVQTQKNIDAEYYHFLDHDDVDEKRYVFLKFVLTNKTLMFRSGTEQTNDRLSQIAYSNIDRYLKGL